MSRQLYAHRRLDAIAARWDARAASWDADLADPACHLNDDHAYQRFLQIVRRLISRRRAFCARHGVIDAGCGTGLVLAEVLPHFAWGLGLDLSPEMVRRARAKRLAGAKFKVADCFSCRSCPRRAGAVLSRGVLLSHYGRAHAAQFLTAARSALLPGGFLVADFLNAAARSAHRHAPGNKTWFRAAHIKSMALEAGFAQARILGAPSRRCLVLLAVTALHPAPHSPPVSS